MENEKRLIYGDAMAVLFRNAAKRIVSDSNGNQYEMGWAHGLIEAADRLKTAPTVDAVEVVRCKDCKRYEENTEARTRFCRRGLGYMYAEPNGFCSYGERRTDV